MSEQCPPTVLVCLLARLLARLLAGWLAAWLDCLCVCLFVFRLQSIERSRADEQKRNSSIEGV